LENLENLVDFYSLLGLKRDASEVEIKQAYRKMAFRYHPDRNPEDKQATEKFNQVLQAYGILSDSTKRNLYDRATRPPGEEEAQKEKPQAEQFGDRVDRGFNHSYDFKAQTESKSKAEPQPRCPQCSARGTDYIVSRKGGAGSSRGKQFVIAPFSVVFCGECGHVYGIMGQSS
jgi:curved DNA-binding protein CbpA